MKKRFIMFFVMILTVLSVVIQPINVVYAFVDEDSLRTNVEHEHDCSHDHDYVEHDIPRNDPNFNINDYVGEIYESPTIEPFSVTANTTCEGGAQHGVGRDQGHSSNFLDTGCISYRRTGYSYGSSNLPFFINTTNMSTELIDEIRIQADIWNQAVMHDGTGQIVNVYEVNHTNNINGRPVCIVMREDGDYAGQFTGSTTAPRIRINQPSRNPDTVMHEFGHYLGLRDTDGLSGVISGTHKTIMGYSRWMSGGSEGQLSYQDIQGIAIANSNHQHDYQRYVLSGGNRIYICFYCDAFSNPTTDVLYGSFAMLNSSTCTHDYDPMVSHGSRHWLKCTKCYKVIESDFLIEGVSGSPITLKITGLLNDNLNSISIPSSIAGQTVKHIGSSAFSGQTQLTQITIPSTVTHIGSDAFKNTNNASIYLEGRTSAPSTFNVNWNFSGNPVYLNGNLCSHNSSTIVSLDDTHHGNRCNDCRTDFNKSVHQKYMSNGFEYCYDCNYKKNISHTHSYVETWINYRQHRSICSCGDKTSLVGHVVSINDNGFPYKTCLVCGGPAEMGFVGFDNLPNMFESLSSIYIHEYFGNDSFILSNGVIVLSDIDLEAYYEGTLILPDSYDVDNHHNHDCEGCYIACIDCDSGCYDCIDYNVMYTYNDRRKTPYIHLNRKEQDFFNDRVK